MPTDTLTRDEEIELAIRIMAQQHEEDLRVRHEWSQQRQRIIIIRERDDDAD